MACCCFRPAAGNDDDGPETPGYAAVGYGADATDGGSRESIVRGEEKHPHGRVRPKRRSDAGRHDEQRQQASNNLGATEWVTHRRPHTGESRYI